MTGRDHIITGACSLAIIGDMTIYMKNHYDFIFKDHINKVGEIIYNFATESFLGLPFAISLIICLAFYLIGVLFPDTDSEKSMLGKFIHIPVRHRTWMHAIWVPLIAIGLSYFVQPLMWFSVGYIVHLFWDSLSVGGICWFYPISRYRSFDSGAQIKKKHWLKLYRTGNTSELIVVIICAIITVALTAYIIYENVFNVKIIVTI
jgi:membrane-bound metal-dependent hydrolase YbcI (DUF457 family)